MSKRVLVSSREKPDLLEVGASYLIFAGSLAALAFALFALFTGAK